MKKRHYALTLLEIMVVISLITLILGVLGYNMKNVLNKGKIFRTEQAIERVKNILDLELANGKSLDDVFKDREKIIKESGFGRKAEDLLKDAWDDNFEFKLNRRDREIEVTSKTLRTLKPVPQ